MSDIARNKFRTLWTGICEFKAMFNNRDSEVMQSLPYQEALVELLHLQGEQTGAWKLCVAEIINPYNGKVTIDGWASHGISKRECEYFHSRADAISRKLRAKFEEANPVRLSEDENGGEDDDKGDDEGKNDEGKGNKGKGETEGKNDKGDKGKDNHRDEGNDGFDDENDDEWLRGKGYNASCVGCDVIDKISSNPNPNDPVVDPKPKYGPYHPMTLNGFNLTEVNNGSESYGPFHPLTLEKERKEREAQMVLKKVENEKRDREIQDILDDEIKGPQWPSPTRPLTPSPTPTIIPELELIGSPESAKPGPSRLGSGRIHRPRDPIIDLTDSGEGNIDFGSDEKDDLEITVSNHREEGFEAKRERIRRYVVDQYQRRSRPLYHQNRRVIAKEGEFDKYLSPKTRRALERIRGGDKYVQQSVAYTREREIEGAKCCNKNMQRPFGNDPYRNFRPKPKLRDDGPSRGRAFTSPASYSFDHDHRDRQDNHRRRTVTHVNNFRATISTGTGTQSPHKRRQKWTPPQPKRVRNNEVERLRDMNREFENTLRQMTSQVKEAIDQIGTALEARSNRIQAPPRLTFSP